ncbi:MAG: class II fumarate hydratase, partial [Thermodesulfobacteriota bacterium]
MSKKEAYRIEEDVLGIIQVPKKAYYGGQTQRAFINFPISELKFDREFIFALGLTKCAAAKANLNLGLMEKKLAKAIERASIEVMEGKWDHEFVVDIFQSGSGTSTNMNSNEVIANRANEILGGSKGIYKPIHPNDHVNKGQSTNDIFPTALHIALVLLIKQKLIPSLKGLHKALLKKSKEFWPIYKIGRTHLQDATPIRLGQEFKGYARQIELGIERIQRSIKSLLELPIGGTAVGTGINTHPHFTQLAISVINKKTGLKFREASDHFEAQGARDASVEMSGILKTIAVSLIKIANDIRWLASGPRCGIGELKLPEVQLGSSIMPGKINPVIPESLIQVCAQVIGNDTAITLAGLGGSFELNVMMPLIAYNLIQSVKILSNAIKNFTEKCIIGLDADRKRCEEMIEKSLSLSTFLIPILGYDKTSKITRKAYFENKTIREVAIEEGFLPPEINN